MAHVFMLSPRCSFFPFGNTPAIGLTDNLSPEEDANVLLLGCGDARSVLYTLSVDEAHGYKKRAKLDVTFCDLESAVLARNIILYTLLADSSETKIEDLWSAYYDLYISDEAHNLVKAQSMKLANLAKSMDDWHSGIYGKWLRITSEHTLASLRNMWERYVKAGSLMGEERDGFATRFAEGIKEMKGLETGPIGHIPEAIRMAGTYATRNIEVSDTIGETYNRYWSMARTNRRPHPNPTLAYSGGKEQFNMQKLANPILGFHLFKALIPTEGSQRTGKAKPEDLMAEAKSQFTIWCTAFRTALAGSGDPNLIIRFFTGDYAALCTAIQHSEKGSIRPQIYPAPWNVSEVVMNKADYGKNASAATKAPTAFNFIDTSNLADHVGLVNIMLTAGPLLHRAPSSVMMTESFRFDGSDFWADLAHQLRTEPLLHAIIFDLVPSSYFVSYHSKSNTENGLLRIMSDDPEFGAAWNKTQWKILIPTFSSTSPISAPEKFTMDDFQVSQFLYTVYLWMFENEAMKDYSTDMEEKGELYTLQKYTAFHYNRETFAKFILAAKSRIECNWDEALWQLLGNFIHNDKGLVGGLSSYVELASHLFRMGVFDDYRTEKAAEKHPSYNTGPPQMLPWLSTAPREIYVSLVVPRKKVEKLFTGDPNIAAPVMHTIIKNNKGESIFLSVQCVFGKIRHRKNPAGGFLKDEVVIKKDEDFSDGKSDLIVITPMPAWIIRANWENVTIAFAMFATPHAVQYLEGECGIPLTLFKTMIHDKRVYVSRYPPNIRGPDRPRPALTLQTRKPEITPTVDIQRSLKVGPDDEFLTTIVDLTAKVTGFSDVHAKQLADGAAVSVEGVQANVVRLKFGTFSQDVTFPLHIRKDKLKTRIARKSKYIEIIAIPVNGISSYANQPAGQQVRFPLIRQNNTLTLWNLHRVNLDKLTALDLRKPETYAFLEHHFNTGMSEKEAQLLKALNRGENPNIGAFIRLKHTISALFAMITKFKEPRFCSVGDYYLFLTDLRLDFSASCVVLDACVYSSGTGNPTDQAMEDLADAKDALCINHEGEEANLWKEFMVSFIERARSTLYSHKPSCEYKKTTSDGKPVPIPLSYAKGKLPFCTCSKGTPSAKFLAQPEWRPFGPYVHRAAIPLLFSCELMDPDAFEHLIKNVGPKRPANMSHEQWSRADEFARFMAGLSSGVDPERLSEEEWARANQFASQFAGMGMGGGPPGSGGAGAAGGMPGGFPGMDPPDVD